MGIPERKFWLIWSPTGYSPKVKHQSHDDAVREARRLAANCHGQSFYVMAAQKVICQPPCVIETSLY